jgi:hypothetical protein
MPPNAVQVSFPGSVSWTGGCRISIVSPNENGSWIDDLLPREAQAALDKLAEHFKDGMSVREAIELQQLKRALQAKAEAW